MTPSRAVDHDGEDMLLKEVSRSFALTIPQLPAGLRERVANAYLLCRIVDTIEDEGDLSLPDKRVFFRRFLQVVDAEGSAAAFAGDLHARLSADTLQAERELVRRTPDVVRTFYAFSPAQRAIVRRCLGVMASGMLRFQEIQSLKGLESVGCLNAYCYHVAGVVGEMLTELFCEYSPEVARYRRPLLARAPSFGMGLQMTNILKDQWEDRARGVCWLPRDVFGRAGLDLSQIDAASDGPRFGEGLEAVVGIAHHHLRDAISYTLYVPRTERGVRRFCLWAIGMALLTLRNIHERPGYRSGDEVKISRSDVRAVVSVSKLTLWNDWLVRGAYRVAARGLPLDPSGHDEEGRVPFTAMPFGKAF